MADDLGERTEEATPKRRQEAREEGNIARSQDAAAGLLLLLATCAMVVGLLPLLELFTRMLRHALEPANNTDATDIASLGDATNTALLAGATAIGPAALASVVVAFLAHVWQVGLHMSARPLRPRASRLNPLSGLRRLLGPQGVIKTFFDLAKLTAVLVVTYATVSGFVPAIVGLPGAEATVAARAIGAMLAELAIKVAATLLVLGLADYMWQRWKYSRDLRMTKQQVKEEYKSTEGDPDVKRRRLQLQRQIAMQRINSSVPKADVIVTNPEHISVAIAYDATAMNAPRVVAKGADHLAMRIRQIARQHGVPIVERKPLARALYAQVRVGQEVPPDLYKAVAEVLAYVWRLEQAAGRTKERFVSPTAARAAG
jgi:flagellar biosynthesis protein FlhB